MIKLKKLTAMALSTVMAFGLLAGSVIPLHHLPLLRLLRPLRHLLRRPLHLLRPVPLPRPKPRLLPILLPTVPTFRPSSSAAF